MDVYGYVLRGEAEGLYEILNETARMCFSANAAKIYVPACILGTSWIECKKDNLLSNPLFAKVVKPSAAIQI